MKKNSMRFLINYKIEVFLFKKLTKSLSVLIMKGFIFSLTNLWYLLIWFISVFDNKLLSINFFSYGIRVNVSKLKKFPTFLRLPFQSF